VGLLIGSGIALGGFVVIVASLVAACFLPTSEPGPRDAPSVRHD
jgi:hypothetical protein